MTVSSGSHPLYGRGRIVLQELLDSDPKVLTDLKETISAPRLEKYQRIAKGDEKRAILLYQWNAQLSQSLYTYIQGWEVGLRNRINSFLCWKYNGEWHYDEKRAIRQMTGPDKRRVWESRERQEQSRGANRPPLSAVVADLSAGFWVSQLSKSYDVPYVWRYNLQRIFPNDKTLDRHAAWSICDDVLTLRNRIAHHEPILHLDLDQRHRDLQRVVYAMCSSKYEFCEEICTFREVWSHMP